MITASVKESNIELLAISDCVEHTDHLKSSQFTQSATQSANQSKSQAVFKNIVEEVGGQLCNISLAETQLLSFQKKKTKCMPWNCPLTIGSTIKIFISAYVKTQEEKFLAPFKTECFIENTQTKMVTEYSKNNQPIDAPDVDNIIKSFQYGSNMVALNDDVSMKDTEKCLSCLGFTKRDLIYGEHLAGEGCHLVLPQKEREKSAALFVALVQAMLKSNLVMIARKVYRNGLNPITVVLVPEIFDNIPTLTMIQLPFANDLTMTSFPKLRTKKNQPTPEQEEAIKSLVDAMDLMNAFDDGVGLSEAFALETTLNPVNQHLLRCVAFRAVNPTEPLPTIDPELIATIDIPPMVKNRSEDAVKEVEKHFPLEIVEQKLKKVFGQKSTSDAPEPDDDPMVGDSLDLDSAKNTVAVGTVNPVEDFTYLLKRGERFGKLAEQMQTVIYDLIFRTASPQNEKILECIMMYREQAKIYGPFSYNTWLKELKELIIQKNRLDFWTNSIVKEGFGLVTINEAPISTVTIDEQIDFYEISAKQAVSTSVIDQDDDDLDALLD